MYFYEVYLCTLVAFLQVWSQPVLPVLCRSMNENQATFLLTFV